MLPTLEEAIRQLHTAGELNPGPWVKHSENVGIAAKNIAHLVPELDENKAWVLWRNSYRWEEKEDTIESIEIRLNRDAKKYIGKSIGNPSQGAEVEIANPATGKKYKITVQEVSDEVELKKAEAKYEFN